ncbi:hypothetical protein ACIBAH_34840 [Streptomyces sp. NPDC051445]|uniref:hypothetical protein n=1 Tax=Streptomyces sp. NPDC051445 TaxID=3365653 RepID=UPI003790CA75
MNAVSQERKYFAERLTEKYGKAYSSILCTMSGLECRLSKPGTRNMGQRILNAKLEGYKRSAVLVLLADEYNEIDTENQAEELVKHHRALYREAYEKDEKDRESWV